MNNDAKSTTYINAGKIFTVMVLIMPILNCYKSPLPSVSIGEIILMFFMPIMFLVLIKDQKIILHRYWLFFIYCIFISSFVYLFNPSISAMEIIKRLIRDFFYTCLIFIFAQNFFMISYALQIYKAFVVFTCIYIILECISFYLFQYTLPWKIPGIDFNVLYTPTEYTQHYESMYTYFFRPTSIFTEPAQFAQYAAPCLLLTLIPPDINEKINMKLALLISVALLLSTSANAYLFLIVIWSMWFLYRNFVLKKSKGFLNQCLIIIILIMVVIYMYNTNNVFSEVIDRVNNLGGDDVNSENLRLLRGYYYFLELNPIYRLFGIGFGSFDDFTLVHSIFDKYSSGNEYMSSLSYILVSAGMIGFTLYLGVMHLIFKRSTAPGKALIVLLLIMLITSSIYSEAVYLIMLAFALYLPQKTAPSNNQNLQLSNYKYANIVGG